MPTVFISYRRADSADITGRVYDRLVERYGRAQVFKDVDSIPPGVDFPEYIEESIQASDVTLVVIGPRWLDASSGWNRRRLDDPADFVRVEIETALRQGIPVIPLLVGGAAPPAQWRLPESLRPLLRQNGLTVRPDPDFSRDMDRVFAAIDYWQAQPRTLVAPTTPEAPTEPATADELPERQPLRQAAPAEASEAAHPAPTERVTPPARVASRPRPRQSVARLPLLLSALAVVLVAGLVLAPSAGRLLNGRTDLFLTTAQRTSTAQAGAATQTAHASATAHVQSQQTFNAIATIANNAKRITLGYTSKNPGCDTTNWIPPSLSKYTCSATGATLSGYSNDYIGFTAYVNESPEVYTVQMTVSHLQGGCAIKLVGDSGTLIISLDAQPTAARWTIVRLNEDNSIRSGTIPLSSSYTLVMRLLTANDYALPNDLTLTINGKLVQNVGEINPGPSGFATYSPGRLTQVLLALHSDETSANRQLSATFTGFRLTA